MRLSDFDFALPDELIAQAPLPQRDASRLLVLDRRSGRVEHRRFGDLPQLLDAGDLLVLNDARVIPARLIGKKAGTQGRVELLIIGPSAGQTTQLALDGSASSSEWLCLGQASKGLKAGTEIAFTERLHATIVEALGEGQVRVRFDSSTEVPFRTLLDEAGRLPLPPYIARAPDTADLERYQTVYARSEGSVAAPTAGLHFTPALFDELHQRGIHRAQVTLDVGPGTFLPVRAERLELHPMHPERYFLPVETAQAVAQVKVHGRRTVAVGTTVVRTLEAATEPSSGRLETGAGLTSLFIRPGFAFRQVDALVTNFHLPKSTLLMLVSAFAGYEAVRHAYEEAVRERYRFFSYGDAMLVL